MKNLPKLILFISISFMTSFSFASESVTLKCELKESGKNYQKFINSLGLRKVEWWEFWKSDAKELILDIDLAERKVLAPQGYAIKNIDHNIIEIWEYNLQSNSLERIMMEYEKKGIDFFGECNAKTICKIKRYKINRLNGEVVGEKYNDGSWNRDGYSKGEAMWDIYGYCRIYNQKF